MSRYRDRDVVFTNCSKDQGSKGTCTPSQDDRSIPMIPLAVHGEPSPRKGPVDAVLIMAKGGRDASVLKEIW